jgi:hypothetical protein
VIDDVIDALALATYDLSSGIEDRPVAGAPAQVSAQTPTKPGLVRSFSVLGNRLQGHDKAGSAESALHCGVAYQS